MRLLNSVFILSIALFFSACTSSGGHRDFNVVDNSATFSNIEVSKTFNERWRVQLESSIASTKGSSISYESPQNTITSTKELVFSNGTANYEYYSHRNSVTVDGVDYNPSKISYDYSVNHKTITGGFDFFHTKHFGMMLSLGFSQYEYSTIATFNGTIDANKTIHLDDPVVFTENGSQVTIYNALLQQKVTNKQINFNFTDYGIYVALEPHYQFNDHYGVSARIATSTGKYTTLGTNLNSEISLRFNYTPIEHLELYAGFQLYSIGNNLSGISPSYLSIDTRGFLGGLALRF